MSTPPDEAHTHNTTPVHETADALRAALREHDLDVPGLSVEQGSVGLGDVTVTTADRLAHLLGAPVQRVERELLEETGVQVDPAHLRLVHIVHHRQSESVERIGFFFEATNWTGDPSTENPRSACPSSGSASTNCPRTSSSIRRKDCSDTWRTPALWQSTAGKAPEPNAAEGTASPHVSDQPHEAEQPYRLVSP